MPDILVVLLFQVSPQAQLLHGKIYYIADRHGESHSRQSSCAKSAAHGGVIARHDVVRAQALDLQAFHLGHEGDQHVAAFYFISCSLMHSVDQRNGAPD